MQFAKQTSGGVTRMRAFHCVSPNAARRLFDASLNVKLFERARARRRRSIESSGFYRVMRQFGLVGDVA